MAYSTRSGDILTIPTTKVGALTLSAPLWAYPGEYPTDPIALWRNSYAVRTVTYYIARKVAAVPMHVYRRVSDTDRERVTDTPLARSLVEPVPGRGWSRFAEQLILDMAIQDRWACLVSVAADGRPQYERLPAEQVAVHMSRGVPQAVTVFGQVDDYAKSGPRVDIPLDRVLFDVAPSAHIDEYNRGDSRLRTLAAVLAELDETSTWRREVAQTGPRVPAVIERPLEAPPWNDESWQRFRRQFSNYRAGGGSEGGTPVLEDGMHLVDTKFLTPNDGSQTIQMRALALEEAAMLYGIPPELIGVRPGNYSNIEALREHEYVDVLGSWVTNLEDAFNAGLRSCGLLGEVEYVEAAVESRLRGAFEDQAKVLSTSVGAPWLTRNEARARMNLPAIDGGDEVITPLNVYVGGQASPQDGGEATPALQGAPPKAVEAKAYPRNVSGAGWPEIYAQCDALERDLLAFWKGQRKRIIQSEEALRAQGGIKAEGKRTAVSNYVMQTEKLVTLLGGRDTAIARAAAAQVLDKWNPSREGWDDADMDGWLAYTAKQRGRIWESDVAQRLADVLKDDEKWAAFLADNEVGQTMVLAKARRWGTETLEFGRHDAARASGVDQKTWRVTNPNPRDSHAHLSGVSLPIDEPFANGCQFPGDWAGGPEEVANCDCTIEYSRSKK